MQFSEEDCDRIATLISDALEDLKIPVPTGNMSNSEETQVWSSKRVQDIARNEGKSWELAKKILVLMGDSESASSTSWKSFLKSKQASSILPSWLRNPNSKDKHTLALERLLFLASSLQQHRLSSSPLASASVSNRRPDQSLSASGKEAAVSSSHLESQCQLPIVLPDSLSDDQRKVIEECYTYMQADYERRRQGMRQRLQILRDNLDIQESSAKQNEKVALSESVEIHELLEHFARPHSLQLSSVHPDRRPSQHAEEDIAFDRGGRVTESESRISMPEWSTERVSAGPKPQVNSSSTNSSAPPKEKKNRKKNKR